MQLIKDITLLIAAVVAIFDKRDLSKRQEIRIKGLEEENNRLKSYNTPEAIKSIWEAQIALANQAAVFAGVKIIDLEKDLNCKTNVETENKKLKAEIESLRKEKIFLEDGIKDAKSSYSTASDAFVRVSGSALYNEYLNTIPNPPFFVYKPFNNPLPSLTTDKNNDEYFINNDNEPGNT